MNRTEFPRLVGITLSDLGADVLQRLQGEFPQLAIHRTDKTAELSRRLFSECDGMIYVMPTGVVLRSIAPLIASKYHDPAVVVLDVRARWCVSLLSGHEGGANRLCERIANVLGAEPIVTTTSEAARNLVVGVGCRRGTPSAEILAGIDAALAQCGRTRQDIRLLASIALKSDEIGIQEAAAELGAGLRFFQPEAVKTLGQRHGYSAFVEQTTGLPAVAEPCAMLAGSRTCLILPRIVVGKTTVAIAEERLSWSESAPEDANTAPTP